MRKTKMPSKKQFRKFQAIEGELVKKAKELKIAEITKRKIVDIITSTFDILKWAGTEGHTKLKKLHIRAQDLKSKAKNANTNEFANECQELLKECQSVEKEIGERVDIFVTKVYSTGKAERSSQEAVSLLDEITLFWKKVVHPMIHLHFEEILKVESRILEMVDFAIDARRKK